MSKCWAVRLYWSYTAFPFDFLVLGYLLVIITTGGFGFDLIKTRGLLEVSTNCGAVLSPCALCCVFVLSLLKFRLGEVF